MWCRDCCKTTHDTADCWGVGTVADYLPRFQPLLVIDPRALDKALGGCVRMLASGQKHKPQDAQIKDLAGKL